MPSYTFKESPDIDYYVEWSSVVEAPVWTGDRAELLNYLRRKSDPYLREDAPHYPERRLERCDKTGTTALWKGHSGLVYKHPEEEGAWEDDAYIYQQKGTLTRANLFILCHRTDEDEDADVSDLLVPLED
jgi:hypothetical protein